MNPEMKTVYGRTTQKRWRQDFRLQSMMHRVEACFAFVLSGGRGQ
jgi:hypothetical protein